MDTVSMEPSQPSKLFQRTIYNGHAHINNLPEKRRLRFKLVYSNFENN
jgi:hypothetical protein